MKEYQALGNAIIIQAAKDYKRILRVIKKHPGSVAALDEAKDLELFFHSRWYRTLTGVDAEYLLDRLRKAVVS